jgi:hypothetical protein
MRVHPRQGLLIAVAVVVDLPSKVWLDFAPVLIRAVLVEVVLSLSDIRSSYR